MTRLGYRAAIEWIAVNDDIEWLTDENATFSVTAAFCADMFGVSTDKVTADLRKFVAKGN